PIKISHHAHAPGARRPHSKMYAGNAIHRLYMRAQLLVSVVMASLTYQVNVKLGQQEREGVGVVLLLSFAVLRVESDAIARRLRSQLARARKRGFKEALRPNFAHGNGFRVVPRDKLRLDRARLEKVDHPVASLRGLNRLRAKHAEGISVARGQDGINSSAQLFLCCGAGFQGSRVRHASILSEHCRATNARKAQCARPSSAVYPRRAILWASVLTRPPVGGDFPHLIAQAVLA